MLVLITYDVAVSGNGAKRLRQVAKECTNYGQRVQNSVFECILNKTQLTEIKHKLETIIDLKHDSLRFYLMGDNWQRKVETIGRNESFDPTSELII